MRKPLLAFAIATALFVPGMASAQSNAAVDTSYGTPPPEDDNDFPWGLLGLLGLAGLIPRKRHDHVNIDNRTNR
ncbi:WGxxGxxG family protein [Sphingomonas sp.]|jgi:MYXO-CTERM domain-containing protein|uniref:WGxxGxxG family protein n=1 Tax=Sphingomonas sp. TaxID=28214 RepID=UPI002DEAAB66|nr:WGxxGxxG family protein [Sphingomonas sp.]